MTFIVNEHDVQFLRFYVYDLTSCPVTKKITLSAILVARSAMRSRSWANHIRYVAR